MVLVLNTLENHHPRRIHARGRASCGRASRARTRPQGGYLRGGKFLVVFAFSLEEMSMKTLTERRVRRAMKGTDNIMELSDRLGVSVSTLYRWFRQHADRIERPYRKRSTISADEVWQRLRLRENTLDDLAESLGCSRSQIRARIYEAFGRRWRAEPVHRFAKPRNIPQIRIWKAVTESPELVHHLDRIRALTGSSIHAIRTYLDRSPPRRRARRKRSKRQ